MILHSLRATAFMRYEQLELTELPRGVIAVVGENEAGKSTVGEAIAFALFGRSIRTEGTDPALAIHWLHDECRTEVEFSLGDEGVYRVERRVGRRGEFEARLLGPDGVELAAEPELVNERLTELLGFDFAIFRYSFYVAQHELDLLQRDSQDNARRIVYDMLGITTLERAETRLEEQQAELRERTTTIERDLLVAEALHTEAAPLRDELAGQTRRLEAAEEDYAAASEVEARQATLTARAQRTLDASRDFLEALGALEGGLSVRALRDLLLARRRRLLTLAQAARSQAEDAARITENAQGREQALRALEAARLVERRAATLQALVQTRAEQLARELSPGDDPESLGARATAQEARVEREVRSQNARTLLAAVLLLLALASGGAAAATRLPEGQPLWTFPEQLLQSPRLGVVVTLTPTGVTLPLGAAAGVAFLGLLLALLARGRARDRRQAEEAARARLHDHLAQARSEEAACRAFKPGPLQGLRSALAHVKDKGVLQALEQLETVAGDKAGGASSPAELLQAAERRQAELEANLAEARPRLEAARRAEAAARASVQQLEAALAPLFPDGLPAGAEAGSAEVPGQPAAVEAEVERLAAEAARARLELEALLSQGRDAEVDGPAEAAQAALNLACAAAGPAEEGHLRERYESQSGLSELLSRREAPPAPEDVRAITGRERAVWGEVFGGDLALRETARRAEEELGQAKSALAQASAELEEARARGQRLEAGARRLEALEERLAGLRGALAPTRRRLEVHREAARQLEELIAALKARFGPAIARYVEQVIPRLTQGRYRRVRVEPDLDIRVFSPERSDFVRLLELSGGTADQVLLALRLGLARALIAARGLRGGHFLFLDEPLISSDAAREQAFLELLRTFDDEFAQIFVASSRSLDEGPFSARLCLSRDQATPRLAAPAEAEA